MNREIVVMREVVVKVTQMLAGMGLTVTQRGTHAYVATNKTTLKPERVNIPFIPDNATKELILAIQGFIDHEVAHILFTDWSVVRDAYAVSNQLGVTHNVVEDTYIERAIAGKFPGSVFNLKQLHEFFVENVTTPPVKAAIAKGDQPAALNYLFVVMCRAWAGQRVFQEYMDTHDYWNMPIVKAFSDAVPASIKAKFPDIKNSREALDVARVLNDIMFPPKKEEEKEEKGEGKGEGKEKKEKGEDGKGKPSKGGKDGKADKSDKKKKDKSEAGSSSEDEGDDEDAGKPTSGGKSKKDKSEREDGPEEEDLDPTEEGDEDGEGDDADADDEGDEDSDDDGSEPGDEEGDGDESSEEEDDGEDEGSGDDDDDGDEEGEGEDAGAPDASSSEGGEDDGEPKKLEGKFHLEGEVEFDPSKFSGSPIDMSKAEFEGALSFIISDHAARDCKSADYFIYTKDDDIIRKHNVASPRPNDLIKLDDLTRHMVAPMQKDIERMMAAKSQVLRIPGFRSGRLHSAGLHRLTTGDERIFRRTLEHRSKETAVMLVIDNSGSMRGDKQTIAMAAGYALAQTLERVGIPNEVIGFTTTEGRSYGGYGMSKEMRDEETKIGRTFSRSIPLYIPIYKEFGERLTAPVRQRFASGAYQQDYCMENIDGEAVEEGLRRLLPRKEPRKVMFVLSDGMPAGGSVPRELYAHLHKQVETAKQMKVDLVGIGIKSAAVKTFYPNHVVLDDINALPKMVMGQIKQILSKS